MPPTIAKNLEYPGCQPSTRRDWGSVLRLRFLRADPGVMYPFLSDQSCPINHLHFVLFEQFNNLLPLPPTEGIRPCHLPWLPNRGHCRPIVRAIVEPVDETRYCRRAQSTKLTPSRATHQPSHREVQVRVERQAGVHKEVRECEGLRPTNCLLAYTETKSDQAAE